MRTEKIDCWPLLPQVYGKSVPARLRDLHSRIAAQLNFGQCDRGRCQRRTRFSAGNDLKTITADGKVSRYPISIIQADEVLRDREGDLWFATTKGIIHLHEGRVDHFTTLDRAVL